MILRGREQRGELRLSAEAVVIGSGAGGAMMARELSARGLSVVVLEMGAHPRPGDFNRIEAEMLERLFQDRGARATSDMAIRILQGRGVGGSTVHNTCLCKRTPPELLEEWAREHAVAGASAEDLDLAFVDTEDELGVKRLGEAELNRNNALFKRGVEALGYRGGFLLHNREGCTGSGYCELGCPFDAKQNALKILIPKALDRGATVVSDARAERIETTRGRASGVRGSLLDAQGRAHATFHVSAEVVCLAASAVGSAALHQVSGLPDPSGRAARGLRIHPGAVVAGVFDEDVVGWKGIPQSYECTEFLEFGEGSQRRVWLVPVFAHPIGTAVQIPGFGPEHAELMRAYPRVAAVTAMVHDRSEGRVRVEPGGRIRIDYRLNQGDQDQLALGLREGARILLAAGARKVLVPYERQPLWIEGEDQLGAIAARGVKPHELPLTAVHPMGTLAMGEDPTRAVVDSRGEHHAVRNLFVCDGSLFPTSIGIPPQLSIYAFSRHLAPHVVASV